MNSNPEFQGNKKSLPAAAPAAPIIITAWIGVFYGCFFLFSRVSFPGDVTAMGVSGLACSLSAFGAVVLLSGKQFPRSRLVVMLMLCAFADIGINLAMLYYPLPERITPHINAGVNLTLIGIAFCGGLLVSEMIKKPSYIIPLAAAAGLADVWSVSLGVTNEIIQSPTAMNFLLFSFPVAGKGVVPIIGVTDFVFATMFLSISRKFDLPMTRTRLLLAASFVLSVGVAVVGGFGVPVLPVMGVLFIVGNHAHVRITDPKEKRDAVLGLLIIVVALAAISLIRGVK